jgi:hypothetical protein
MFDGRKYKWETAMFDGRKYKWDGTTALWANATTQNSTKSSMELVTSPSNPDALLPQLGCNLAADPEIQPWTFKL